MLNLVLERKETKMIATAIALQQATQEAVHDEMTMDMASHLFHARNEMSDNDFARALFEYSALLSSLTTTLVTHVLLTEEQVNAMISDIKEFDELGKDVTNGN
jgi:hypothetical protein